MAPLPFSSDVYKIFSPDAAYVLYTCNGGQSVNVTKYQKNNAIWFSFLEFAFYSSEIRFSMSLRYFFRILVFSLVISMNFTPIPPG